MGVASIREKRDGRRVPGEQKKFPVRQLPDGDFFANRRRRTCPAGRAIQSLKTVSLAHPSSGSDIFVADDGR